MRVLDTPRGEFIDAIEWTEAPQSDVLAWRFPRYQNEIRMGAKLLVREGQNAVLVNEGRLADIYRPGKYMLITENMPILKALMGWKYGFVSPFKAEVYFISTRQWTGQEWATQNPIVMRDPEVGAVRIRAFGTYAFHVADPNIFLQQLVLTDPSFETVHSPQKHCVEISNQLRHAILSRLADVIGTAKIPVLDLAVNYHEISRIALETIGPDLTTLGLALTLFSIENISLPPEAPQALGTRPKMGAPGDMNRYAQYQSGTATDDAAKNPGGTAGVGTAQAAAAE